MRTLIVVVLTLVLFLVALAGSLIAPVSPALTIEVLKRPVAGDVDPMAGGGTRDPMIQPFSNTSIWNMPIGTSARYVPAEISDNPRGETDATMPMADEGHIVMHPDAPATDIMYSDAGWGGNRCDHTSDLLTTVPMPSSYTVPNSGGNDSTTFLRSDRRTLVQMQPFARCSAGSVGTAMVVVDSVDLYGDGITGAHGGSGLSALGGTLRVGELRPDGVAPKHALKVLVDAASELKPCTSRDTCYRWPATHADTYAVGYYGSVDDSAPTGMRMGALLAIPQSLDLAALGFETAAGAKLAWTLQNYGAYVVDDVYSAGFGFATENGPDGSFNTQFQSDYGYAFTGRVQDDSPWVRDIRRIVSHLSIVENNGPTNIGGGGTPLQPLALALPDPGR